MDLKGTFSTKYNWNSMIPFKVVNSDLKLCSFTKKSFWNFLLMASLPRDVDSWSSGEVWRNIMEGIEDLKSEKLLYALTVVYESGTWFESEHWNEVSTSLRSNPGARQWSPRVAWPAPLGWCQWSHPMLRDQSWSGTACQTSFSSSWGQFRV